MSAKDLKRRLGPGRLTAVDSAGLNDRLLDAAQVLFCTDGYAVATMERIAKASGASTKTIYSRYANKGEILQAVVRRIVDNTLAAHAAEIAIDARNAEPRAFLTGFARQIVTRLSTDAIGLNRLAFAEAHRFPELSEFYLSTIGRGIRLLQDALEKWHQLGFITRLPDAEMAARLCISLLTDRPRILGVLGKPLSPPEIDAHVAAAVDIFLLGCGYAPKKNTGSR
jgi:AcrR family transcriptional regulator